MQSLGRSLKIEALVLFCQCHLEACMCGPNRQWGCCLLRRARCGCIGKAEAQQHATMSISFWGPSGRKRARWTLTSQTWKSLCSNEKQLRSARDTCLPKTVSLLPTYISYSTSQMHLVIESHCGHLCSQEQSTVEGGWGALLKRRYRRIMILAAALPILQQASGINTVVFYSSDVGPDSHTTVNAIQFPLC